MENEHGWLAVRKDWASLSRRCICWRNRVRKASTLLVLAVFLVSPAAGFDSYWHSECVRRLGEQFGFSEDASKIMQLGNFSPDFFGPVSEYAAKGLKGEELNALNQLANNSQVRGAAIFLHFDNLNGDLHANS